MIWQKPSTIRKYLFRIFWIYLGAFILCLLVASIFTIKSLFQLKELKVSQASYSAKIALIPLHFSQVLTLNQPQQLKTWKTGLITITTFPEIYKSLEDSIHSFTNLNQPFLTPLTIETLNKTNQSFQDFYQLLTQDSVVQAILPLSRKKQLTQISLGLPQMIKLGEYFLGDSLNILFLLQNSDEIRASGGFIGSLASMDINHGILNEPVFYDIYDLANRIERLPDSPVGVKQYLSSGQGLALTDANWEADFSQSAQQILQMIQTTELTSPNLIIAINLDLLREILLVTGPVTILDSQQQVYADNLAELARKNRLEFFSGDKQKKIFLQQIYQALKVKLQQLQTQDQIQLLQIILQSIQHKNILIYSPDPDIQQLATKQQATGTLVFSTDYFLYLLESNVGINKANQAVSREIQVSFKPDLITITIEFFNNNQPLSQNEIEKIRTNQDLNQAEHLGYVNYQRVITELPIKQAQVICNGNTVELEEESHIQTSQGEVNQLGFLLTVPEQNSTKCIISLQPEIDLDSSLSWTIVKQPGLPPTPYILNFFDQEKQLILNQDYLLPEL